MALTAAQQKTRWNDFVQWYSVNVGNGRGDSDHPMPKELKKLYMANDGAWGTDRAMQWIRRHDPNYLRTNMATSRMEKLRDMYEQAFGYKINWKSKEMKNYLENFARSNPNIDVEQRLTSIFMKRILPSKSFKTANPGFASWLVKNRTEYAQANIMSALQGYNQHRESLNDFWQSKTGGEIPAALLNKALANDWQENNVDFLRELSQSSEWGQSQSYADRARDFQAQWESIFAKEPVDAGMQDAYSRNISGMNFGEFFHSVLKKSEVFKQKFTGYTKWEADQHAGGKREEDVDIFDYFTRRKELEEMWNENFSGGELPDQLLLDDAMKNNWGDALFISKLRKTPQYANSGAGKDKALKFDTYWRNLFGESSPVDTNLRSRFIGSDVSDPGVYWNDIKQTDMFKQQFSSWNAFANAQGAAGINVTEDPAQYNKYKEAFRKSFEDIGMEVPEGMDRTIFASGVSGDDLTRRAELWKTTENAYKLQTGQKADLAKTLGVTGNKAQAGDMRLRMQKAFEQQRRLAQSKFASADTEKAMSGFTTQKI